ncbi:MAG: histidine phosphatase family protein [Phycisphaerales bacterium]|nr:histidine phosphatase family protein [Phycisphaerales bacterium]
MRVYIIRHAKAHRDSESGRDEDRELKNKGFNQSKALAQHLALCDQPPAMVIASPYTRAQQTARPIWEILDQQPQTDDRLAAHRSVADALDVLVDTSGAQCVAIIAHNPTVSRVVDLLIHGPSAPGMTMLRTGELIALDIDPNEMLGSAELADQFRMGSSA